MVASYPQAGLIVRNAETKFAITAANNVAAGDPVKATSDRPINLTINPTPTGPITHGTFYDKQSKLYVGADRDESGSRLTWVTRPNLWTIARTATGDYHIFHPQFDLYWSQDDNIAPDVQLKTGREIRGKEAFWVFQHVIGA
ncbi:hypothetical protein APHAL10511_001395 [Amanita phalloides]|nr:hypothetical protein APHAL10511_001395 [Amanita phalloides]